MSTYDEENGPLFDTEFEFSEKSIRLGFIRKVYSILMCQLSVSVLFIVMFLYVPAIKNWSMQPENQWLWIVAFVLTFVCLIVLACCENVRRKWPLNFIFLGIFTICESFLLGSVASHYQAWEVLVAVGVTTVVALSLTIFAFQTKWDFTMLSGTLLVCLVVLFCFGILCAIIQSKNFIFIYFCFGILCAIIQSIKILSLVYSCLGALLFAMYLVFDTQLMMGGKHKYSISPEEYIFAALNLYLDIVNLFLMILSIIGNARN